MLTTKEKIQAAETVELRRMAEELTQLRKQEMSLSLPLDAEQRHLHELQVYQIELELQNAELSQSRDEVELLLENYTELYDFAPVGYCTLDKDGTIKRVNLTGATLLGDHRLRLISRNFSVFVADEDRPIFKEMLQLVFNGEQKKSLCEVTIYPQGLRSPTPVKIVAMASSTSGECLVVVIDISERKRLESEILIANDELKLRRAQEQAAELLTLNRQLTQEIETRKKLEETLRDSQLRLRNLSANLQFIREEERKAIAREIHDELGQLLAAIQMGVSLLADDYVDHRHLVSKIHEMDGLIGEGIRTVQRIASELRPAMLDVLGLADALEWQAQDFQKRTGISCKITVLLLKREVKPAVAIALYRIFQEALTNVLRHSSGKTVTARLVERHRNYSLTLADDGKGITPAEIASPFSIGLIGIRERLFILGGRMKICGYPGKGTILSATIPVKQKEP